MKKLTVFEAVERTLNNAKSRLTRREIADRACSLLDTVGNPIVHNNCGSAVTVIKQANRLEVTKVRNPLPGRKLIEAYRLKA